MRLSAADDVHLVDALYNVIDMQSEDALDIIVR